MKTIKSELYTEEERMEEFIKLSEELNNKNDNSKTLDIPYRPHITITDLQSKLNNKKAVQEELERQKELNELSKAVAIKLEEAAIESKINHFKQTLKELEKIKESYVSLYKENVEIKELYNNLLKESTESEKNIDLKYLGMYDCDEFPSDLRDYKIKDLEFGNNLLQNKYDNKCKEFLELENKINEEVDKKLEQRYTAKDSIIQQLKDFILNQEAKYNQLEELYSQLKKGVDVSNLKFSNEPYINPENIDLNCYKDIIEKCMYTINNKEI